MASKHPGVKAAAKAEELVRHLDRLHHRFMAQERSARHESLPLSRQEFQLIHALGAGPRTMGELAGALAAPMSSLTTAVDRLVAKRLARRERSTADRRVVRVCLSPGGCRFHEAAYRARLRMAGGMLAALTPVEQDQFMALVRKTTGGDT